MNLPTLRVTALSAAVIGCLPSNAFAQLEEIIVTATRRETNLQTTALSIQAFTSEDLELGGITNGRDLGIMVPNVVLNPATGGAQDDFYIRGLPGVGLYVDGVWQDGFGFQQSNFVEMERIEVLRGPQGTLFGRNTNGGAVNMTTRLPADEFGARVKLDVGDFNRRDASLAVDLPITDTLKTKFMGATYRNDGFIEGLTTPWDFGSQDDTILRADVLWEPTDNFSLRFTHNDEQKRGTDPKIHRMTRYENGKVLAYNAMLGAFQDDANAACAGNPGFAPTATSTFACGADGTWPTPPTTTGQVGARYTGDAAEAFTPTTHTTNWGGGELEGVSFAPGQVGKWQTRSDSMEDGITADLEYTTLTASWDIRDNLNFEAILSTWEQDQRQVIDFDGTEFLVTTDDIVQFRENETMEFHLSGSALEGRISWLAGYYSLEEDLTQRFYRWGMYEFALPNTGPADPDFNIEYSEYVRDTAHLLGIEATTIPGVPSGGQLLTPDDCSAGGVLPVGSFPYNRCRYNWNFSFITDDALTNAFDEDTAWFGEATFGVTERLDLTVGARFSDKEGGDFRFTPADAFRTPDPGIRPQGDPFAYSAVELENINPDTPTIKTYKFAAQYQTTDDLMIYASYSEGFTESEAPIITIGESSVVPSGCSERINPTQVICAYQPEVIETKELGLRSDWLGGRLRFNATYFDSQWNNMRVTQLPRDPAGNTQPFPYQSGEGSGTADGFEFELIYVPTDRLQLNLGLGLIDTTYIQAGSFDGVTGNFPGAPFAYAADNSGTFGVTYDVPLANGGHIMLVGNYGWMDDYARDAAYQRTLVDANGNPVLEPGYGIVNARFVYEPADRNYSVEVWGKNLTDELYVNGGFDTRDIWGYDFSIIGRSREVGVSLGFEF
jgi:outer membrane receptor protein involved in Fe transport